MEVRKVIKTILNQEEHDLIKKTADLLREICYQYDEDDCTLCPMHAFCNGNYKKPPHNRLYGMLTKIEVK